MPRNDALAFGISDALAVPNEAGSDLQEGWQCARSAAVARPTKLGSTVRYLGIEVDHALSISEQVEL